jgi:hypothetical protein
VREGWALERGVGMNPENQSAYVIKAPGFEGCVNIAPLARLWLKTKDAATLINGVVVDERSAIRCSAIADCAEALGVGPSEFLHTCMWVEKAAAARLESEGR